MHNLSKIPFVIISVNVSGHTWEDVIIQANKLKDELTNLGLKFKAVSGRFRGQTENSFLITGIHENEAFSLAERFGQETYLFVDKNREAWLIYVNGSESKYLGYFMEGKSDDNYTIDNGVKYVCSGVN